MALLPPPIGPLTGFQGQSVLVNSIRGESLVEPTLLMKTFPGLGQTFFSPGAGEIDLYSLSLNLKSDLQLHGIHRYEIEDQLSNVFRMMEHSAGSLKQFEVRLFNACGRRMDKDRLKPRGFPSCRRFYLILAKTADRWGSPRFAFMLARYFEAVPRNLLMEETEKGLFMWCLAITLLRRLLKPQHYMRCLEPFLPHAPAIYNLAYSNPLEPFIAQHELVKAALMDLQGMGYPLESPYDYEYGLQLAPRIRPRRPPMRRIRSAPPRSDYRLGPSGPMNALAITPKSAHLAPPMDLMAMGLADPALYNMQNQVSHLHDDFQNGFDDAIGAMGQIAQRVDQMDLKNEMMHANTTAQLAEINSKMEMSLGQHGLLL